MRSAASIERWQARLPCAPSKQNVYWQSIDPRRLKQKSRDLDMGDTPTVEKSLPGMAAVTEHHAAAERQSTDDSLRMERDAADQALAMRLFQLEEMTNALIGRARARADAALSVSRGHQDRAALAPDVGAQSLELLTLERRVQDQAIRKDRARADAELHDNVQETVGEVSRRREDTDRDLDIERADADAAVATRDEFLAIVSHDLRSMLHALVGHAELIGREAASENKSAKILALVELVERSGARMNRLIGDLVDIGCIEAGTLALTSEDGSAADVVAEAVSTLQAQAQASEIDLRAEILADVPWRFDSARILQVLVNLVSNAIKFTRARGAIVVRLEHSDSELRFTVRDDGTGIPSDKLEAVFERYRQVDRYDRRGVGLGLYISKCIVEGHGGRIWTESTLGKGSSFFFTLPNRVSWTRARFADAQ
jgi:signal transduction histidine kinase